MNTRESFSLPIVINRPDRYCHGCGNTVKSTWLECRNHVCLMKLDPVVPWPELPTGWTMCRKCHLAPLRASQRFCAVCRFRTEEGTNWNRRKSELTRSIMMLQESFRQESGASPGNSHSHSHDGQREPSPGPSRKMFRKEEAIAPVQKNLKEEDILLFDSDDDMEVVKILDKTENGDDENDKKKEEDKDD